MLQSRDRPALLQGFDAFQAIHIPTTASPGIGLETIRPTTRRQKCAHSHRSLPTCQVSVFLCNHAARIGRTATSPFTCPSCAKALLIWTISPDNFNLLFTNFIYLLITLSSFPKIIGDLFGQLSNGLRIALQLAQMPFQA